MNHTRTEPSFEERMAQRDERIAQRVVARLLPYVANWNGSGGSDGSKGPLTLVPKIHPRLLTVKQAAVYIGRSSNAVYKLVHRLEIPFIRRGRNLRFDVRELDKWIEGDKSWECYC